ncbi:MAG: BON domain-containing protein [Candidatus Hydrogenedentes bacterium]|nr:BON domain-containing protein [Candidatus Hydrogenedentota bacterium]
MRIPGYLLAAAMLIAPLAYGAEVPVIVDDAAITSRIESMYLLNTKLNPLDINTTTVDGVVTITGSVKNQAQKDLAEELAFSVEGVKKVENNITVISLVIGEKERRTWKGRVEDKTVTTSVRARLLYHSQLKGLTIGVATVNCVVTLSGVVASDLQRQLIVDITKETRAVKGVVDNLTVRGREDATATQFVGQQFTDEWLESRVETAIVVNRHLSIRELDVEVNDGVCYLTGSVASEDRRELAGQIAGNLQGITEVDNQITVRSGEAEIIPGTKPEKGPVNPKVKGKGRAVRHNSRDKAPATEGEPFNPAPDAQPEAPAQDEELLLEPLDLANPAEPRVEANTLPAP